MNPAEAMACWRSVMTFSRGMALAFRTQVKVCRRMQFGLRRAVGAGALTVLLIKTMQYGLRAKEALLHWNNSFPCMRQWVRPRDRSARSQRANGRKKGRRESCSFLFPLF